MATRAVSTVVTYRAWDTSANAAKTGDVANHTLKWIKDGTAASPTNSPSEVDATNAPGVYKLTLTSTETDCTFGVLAGKSSTANIAIFGVQVGFEYVPTSATTFGAFIGNATAALSVNASGQTTFSNTSIATVTNLTNLPSIPANWLTATGIAASALNGKGDWNIGKTGYSLAAGGLSAISTWIVDITGNISGSVGSVSSPVAVTSNIKQNTGAQNLSFTMTDSTNHNPAPGLTVSASRSINGAAFSACTNSVTEIASGDYNLILSAADTNGKSIMYRFTATGADDLNLLIITQP